MNFCFQIHNYVDSRNFMRIVIFLFTIYVTAREIYQFILAPMRYLRSLENYLDCTLIMFLVLISFDVHLGGWQPTIAAAAILLISIEIFLLVGSLPFWSYSTYYIILKTVAWSFLKSLSLYSIVLLALSFSMYALQQEPSDISSTNKPESNVSRNCNDNDIGLEDTDGDRINILLMIKDTMDMLNGKIDEKSQHFKSDDFRYYFCHIISILVTMVVGNLFRGLAVTETQAIKSETELTKLIRRTQVLMRYKKVFNRRYKIISMLVFNCLM